MTVAPFRATAPFVDGLAAVEASAGTGKTWSITSLVVRLVVEDAVPIDRVLVVTFTRAATAELVDRIRGRLGEAAAALRTGEPRDDAVLAALLEVADRSADGRDQALLRVERALRDVDEATISTLHGFCQRVLQQAALAADADPAVTVDGDREASLLLEEVVGDWEVALVRDADPRVAGVLATLGLDRDGLLALARTALAEPDAVVWPPPDPTGDPVAGTTAALDRFADALAAADEADTDWQAEHGVTHRGWRVGPVKLPQLRAELRAVLDTARVPTAKQLRAHAHLLTDAQRAKGLPPPPSSVAAAELLAALHVVEQQVRDQLVVHVRAEVARRRRDEARIGFEGLLRSVDAALDDPTTRAALVRAVGDAHDAVFVDEFQDTDPVQWRILQRLFGGARRFVVVGDPKQAIYGWRGADLQTYLDAVDEAVDHRTMTTNWRSDPRYLAACNHLLDRAGVFGTDDLAYVRVDPPPGRAPGLLRDADGAPRSGLVLAVHRREDESGATNLGVGRRQVAATTAEDVVATLAGGWTLPADEVARGEATDRDAGDGHGDRRPVGPQDCVVLVRSNREARLVAAALRARGVQPTLGGGQDVFASDEAAEVQHLLTALLERGRQPLVRRVLVGPFAALDAPTLAGLDEAAWDAWSSRLRGWHDTWQRHGVAALLERAAREGGAEVRLAARPDGERVLTNLRHLAELLHVAAREEALGTHALLAWLRARRADADQAERDATRAPVERELRLERDDAAVRVLTVHAAKGLEFPLVWAPYLWSNEVRSRTTSNRNRAFVVNDPDADGRRTLVNHAAATYATDGAAPARLQRLWAAHDVASWEAGLRLAYVALTRAVHRCVVDLGVFKDVAGSSIWHQVHGVAGVQPHDPGTGVRAVRLDDDALLAPVAALAEHEAIELVERPPGRPDPTQHVPHQAVEVDDLHVARWAGRDLDVAWGRTSYTALLRRRWSAAPGVARADAEVRDHDAGTDVDTVGRPDLAVDGAPGAGGAGRPVPLATLPRGAAWGTFLHGVLEHTDFATDRATLLALVREQARAGPLPVDPSHHGTVVDGLLAALATPLGPALGGLRLRDVARADRLDELRFTLALADADRPVSITALADVLAAHADDHPGVPLLATADHLRAGGAGPGVHGLLVGAIDLVLRERSAGGPRWWVVDYKSNGLGRWVDDVPVAGAASSVAGPVADGPAGDPSASRAGAWREVAADHHPDRVLAAMVHHDYLLQAHLYVVALHRHLRARLGATYDYDTHMGGWAYLFLRGMTGADVLRTSDGRSHGVATGRPSRALVEHLERVLAPGEGAS